MSLDQIRQYTVAGKNTLQFVSDTILEFPFCFCLHGEEFKCCKFVFCSK